MLSEELGSAPPSIHKLEKYLKSPIQRRPESGVSQKHNTALKLELMNASKYLTWCSLFNTESIVAKIKNVTNKDNLQLRKGPYRRCEDSGQREAEMYAIFKTILDIQASQLTLVSPRGVMERGDWPWLTPPPHAAVEEKALEQGCG